jgi:hypothetical protein
VQLLASVRRKKVLYYIYSPSYCLFIQIQRTIAANTPATTPTARRSALAPIVGKAPLFETETVVEGRVTGSVDDIGVALGVVLVMMEDVVVVVAEGVVNRVVLLVMGDAVSSVVVVKLPSVVLQGTFRACL